MRFLALGIGILAFATRATGSEDPLGRRGELGASLGSPTATAGARVRSVAPGSAAQRAGLRLQDQVLRIGKRPLNDLVALKTALNGLRAGEPIDLEIVRGEQTSIHRVTPSAVPREILEGVETTYGSVVSVRGERLRTILTRPKGASGRLPGLLLAGWLSCDSVESPPERADGFGRVLHEVAKRSGYAFLRVDKPGTGDSDGVCSETDFAAELAGYRAAFRALGASDFVDPERIVILGMSNGGGFAPLVPDRPVAGYVVSGGWSKTWFEHMMEIERRRLSLAGGKPGEVSAALRGASELYSLYLNGKKTPGEIIRERPELGRVWEDAPGHQYGRPARFFHQLQELNLAAVWEKVNVPVLAVYGQFDWIMSRDDHERIAAIVSRNRPGAGRFAEIPKMDHFYLLHDTAEQSFRDEPKGTFATPFADLVVEWLRARAVGARETAATLWR